jgi:hypothetical protein
LGAVRSIGTPSNQQIRDHSRKGGEPKPAGLRHLTAIILHGAWGIIAIPMPMRGEKSRNRGVGLLDYS